jgi:opacity protein-like surface antigen
MNIEMDDLKKDMTGFSAGFVKGFSLSSQSPIFAEIGANFQYLKSNLLNEDYGGDRLKLDLNMYSVNIPLNIGYKYAINEGFSIFPYAGISARGNISGKLVASLGSEEESVDIFDKDEMEDLEFKTFKRLQIGWQIGFGVNFNRLYLSASYGGDFNEVAEELKLSTAPSITLGINF